MNKNENGFSLVVVVIFMSIAALFIGYLMGSWLISFLVEDNSTEIAEQEQNTPNASQELQQNREQTPESEEVNNTENNLTAPTEEELNIAPEQNTQELTEGTANSNQDQSGQPAGENETSSQENEIVGGFGVQIGAFSNYNNALSVEEDVEDLGYEVVVTDSSPHQVQVTGYESRDEAEAAAQNLEAEGYPGFIVIRE
ncbi:sporulation related protein [Halanaerobium saccharolyticum]|uniref:Sporulation related protein n=1 Tax=Halanaerobium saccharolyticum TaxID=43595 RepID=A0A4R7Z5C6_9FIRM|nr:SPOR domain-containing protein [Halanaerobium saccharolyticum]RAK09376.1 sporulation related protein [Halanaerobium saccharolyticum]TDW06235.1 sporulation related protein [Halanaerobium saccharolyticum]TDX61029.1 sporulation related protein [Halanaerobium saccharolyticum]